MRQNLIWHTKNVLKAEVLSYEFGVAWLSVDGEDLRFKHLLRILLEPTVLLLFRREEVDHCAETIVFCLWFLFATKRCSEIVHHGFCAGRVSWVEGLCKHLDKPLIDELDAVVVHSDERLF